MAASQVPQASQIGMEHYLNRFNFTLVISYFLGVRVMMNFIIRNLTEALCYIMYSTCLLISTIATSKFSLKLDHHQNDEETMELKDQLQKGEIT